MERGTKKPRWVPGLGNCIKSGSLDPTNRLTVSTVVQHAARGGQIEWLTLPKNQTPRSRRRSKVSRLAGRKTPNRSIRAGGISFPAKTWIRICVRRARRRNRHAVQDGERGGVSASDRRNWQRVFWDACEATWNAVRISLSALLRALHGFSPRRSSLRPMRQGMAQLKTRPLYPQERTYVVH